MAEGPQLCRDCLATEAAAPHPARLNAPQDGRCPECGSPRVVRHPELHDLAIAHIDCDAFYASIEKRDDPSLVNKPVIVGGGRRGVVAAACYVARLYGVRSAMPMFKALEACPDAVVIRPNMAKYREAGLKIREMMRTLTPRVQPLSIDEAFLDLSDLDRQHRGSPATALARLVLRIEHDCGVSASVGLSYNKFLAKIASDLNKPRGFAVIGRAEAQDFLAPKPVGLLWGVGKALQARMRRDGLTTIGQLQGRSEAELVARYGSIGSRLFRFARGEDDREVTPDSPTKSISAETTFLNDLNDPVRLQEELWPLCETVARRLRDKGLAGRTVTIKLKDAAFQLFTRSRRVAVPAQQAQAIFETAAPLLRKEATGRAFRLIGVGVADLAAKTGADATDLFADAPHG